MRSDVVDVVLVGAGIMSATLATLLKKLDPSLTILIVERLERAAAESSDAWNNAGTGHSAFCELNYTPALADGGVDSSKALRIAEQFEQSKQFWASLVATGDLPDPSEFIRRVPHLSFVEGESDLNFLQTRYTQLITNPLFAEMEITTERSVMQQWAPLMMQDRPQTQVLGMTRMGIGSEVNFGALTRALIQNLTQQEGVSCVFGQEVRDFRHKEDGIWRVKVRDMASGDDSIRRGKFVFIGAGGGALSLLNATDIPQADGYGGFPVSGQFLRCTNPDVIAQHDAKVYGKAKVGAPPMSVPHLDTRWINGERELLFGPYAGFSTKFLKRGSYLDFLRSLDIDNIVPILFAGAANIDLTEYLIGQVMLDKEERMGILRQYYPAAVDEDWEAHIAGQRVQIIKRDAQRGGVLQFGTEIVVGANRSVAALLGASPGASTAVSIMLALIETCFPDQVKSSQWQAQLRALIPSYGQSMANDVQLCARVRRDSLQILQTPSL